MQVAGRMKDLGIENAFKVLSEINRLKALGRGIISFAIGEPDFDTPCNIKESAIKALKENYTHYSPSAGVAPLRGTIARHISSTRNIDVSPEEVVVTPGGKPVIFYSLLCLVKQGDEVIYPNPGYPIYESIINFIGAKAVPLPIIEEKNFCLDTDYLKKIITPKTKMLIINSPHNPTGGIIEKEDLSIIAELALKNNITVLSDEIYSEIIFDSKFCSISSFPEMKERTIILDGMSKTYSMTGWRIGYGIFPRDIAEHIANLVNNTVSCTATFTQIAGIEALEGPQDDVRNMVEKFKSRRELIVSGLNSIEGIKCLKPKGAFYVFPNVTKACQNLRLKNSTELQGHLLNTGNVAVLPRSSFGVKNEGEMEEYIRLSYAVSSEEITEGLKRIKKAIEV